MLAQLSRLFHVSADYILNGDSPDNLDPVVNEAIEILNNLKTDKATLGTTGFKHLSKNETTLQKAPD